MQKSGNKLVWLMCTLAAVAAVVGWWTRYESTHLAAEFWGHEASELLRGPSQVELLKLEIETESFFPLPVVSRYDITKAKGLSHLRGALVEDRNFDWDQHPPIKPEGCNPWAWGLRFYSDDASLTVLLSSDFSMLGKLHPVSKTPTPISCPALAKPMVVYFRSLEEEFSVGRNER